MPIYLESSLKVQLECLGLHEFSCIQKLGWVDYILEVSFSWLKYCISKAPLPDLNISRDRADQFIDHFPLRAARRVGLSGEEVSEGCRDLKGEGE